MLQRSGARALTRSYDSRRRTGRENDAMPDSHGFYQCAFEMPFEMRWDSGHIWIKSLFMVQKVPWRYRVLKGLILVSSRKQGRELSQNPLLYTRHLRQEKRPGNCPQSNHGIFWVVSFFPATCKTSHCLLWIHSLNVTQDTENWMVIHTAVFIPIPYKRDSLSSTYLRT